LARTEDPADLEHGVKERGEPIGVQTKIHKPVLNPTLANTTRHLSSRPESSYQSTHSERWRDRHSTDEAGVGCDLDQGAAADLYGVDGGDLVRAGLGRGEVGHCEGLLYGANLSLSSASSLASCSR
jgi:hypothetical protein